MRGSCITTLIVHFLLLSPCYPLMMTANASTTNGSTCTEKKVIAVMGATGKQGGAVVKALLKRKDTFAIRAITRNPTSEKAKALLLVAKNNADTGDTDTDTIDIVQADADDVDSMTTALDGAYGAFMVTDFWQDMDMQHEIETTRKLQEAAKAAGVKHVVLSTLEDTRPIINASNDVDANDDVDTWRVLEEDKEGISPPSYVPHFDGKGEAGERFLESVVPTTLLFTCFYYDNFIDFQMGPKQNVEGQPPSITFPTGDKPFFMMSLSDFGEVVSYIFQNPETTINTKIGVASSLHTGAEIAAAFSKVLNREIVFNPVKVNAYANFGFPGAADLANMFRYWTTFTPPHLNIDSTAAMLVGVGVEEQIKQRQTVSLEKWIEANKDAFPL